MDPPNYDRRIFHELANLYPLWHRLLTEKSNSNKETNFINQVIQNFGENSKILIDLGGGIGRHAVNLIKLGYHVTCFDQSEEMLKIAQVNSAQLIVSRGNFETINLTKFFDAGICMWTTLPYITLDNGRQHFFKWIKKHIRKVLIFDQSNFYLYPKRFNKTYSGENKHYSLKIQRSWILKNQKRLTRYQYYIFDKQKKERIKIVDKEIMTFLHPQQIQLLLGEEWRLVSILGDYDPNKIYQKKSSKRLITIFAKA